MGKTVLLLFCDDQAPPMTSFNPNCLLTTLTLGLRLHRADLRSVNDAVHSTCTQLTACSCNLLSLSSRALRKDVPLF